MLRWNESLKKRYKPETIFPAKGVTFVELTLVCWRYRVEVPGPGVEVSSQIIQSSHLKSGPGNIGKSGGLRSGKGILPSTSPPLATLFERLAQKI